MTLALLILPRAAAAQAPETKPATAVYVAGDAIPDHRKAVLETHLLKAIINSGADVSGDNAAAFLAAVKEEQTKRRTTALNDGLLCEIGRKTGVKFICAATVTPAQTGVFKLSGRMLSVKTGTSALKGETAGALETTADIESACATLVNRMLGKTSGAQNKPEPKSGQAAQTAPTPTVSAPPPAATAAPPSAATAASSVAATVAPPPAATTTPPAATTAAPPITAGGGKVVSLTIYVPQSTGLTKNQSYIPALVQGEFVSNFSKYSAISILDWERLDDIYVKLVNEAYDDNSAAKQDVALGRLAPTSHFLTGNITKTATGYNIKMNITATADKMTVASYSGTFSFEELDNLTGIRRASLELLQKVGVELTDNAKQELAGAAEANQVSAQTALAKGVTAQRAGTEVAALSYFYQAASFNPALVEAVKRSTITEANIKSGNIGADLRNDIVWRKNWVARLKETEETVYEIIKTIMDNAADPPYTLAYYADIEMGKVNYQTETADLSISVSLSTYGPYFTATRKTLDAAAQATSAVLEGLNATNRKKEWGLAKWPQEGVSNTNPFASASKKEHNITVAFELVNQQGKVIGRSTPKFDTKFSIKRSYGGWFALDVIGEGFWGISFKGVNANDISDNLTIRVATVNGVPPEKARVSITAKPKDYPRIDRFSMWRLNDARDGKNYYTVGVLDKKWMVENLRYKPTDGNSWCYNDSNSNCDKYGRLYDLNTAMNVCPAGWHLPTKTEWEFLGTFISNADVNTKELLIGGLKYRFMNVLNTNVYSVWWFSITAISNSGTTVRCRED